MTTTLQVTGQLAGTETLSTSEAPAGGGDQTINYNEYNEQVSLTGSTTPSIDHQAVDLSHTLSGASEKDFDLTAAPAARDINESVDLTGGKLVGLLIKANTGNAGAVTVAPDATNGYDLFGSGGSVVLDPGERIMLWFNSVASGKPAVAAGAKVIQFSGTDGDGWDAIAYFGT